MKKIISVLFITIICLIFIPNKNFAVLQSNGNTPVTYGLNDYIVNIRKMEELGGAMGLTETLNENLTSTTSNNVDVHLERNTEYGAMAILSASSYGNPNKINNGETTTGNKTGIVMMINSEVMSVQGHEHVENGPNIEKAANRYKDVYSDGKYVKKNGDALEETNGWHGSNKGAFFSSNGKCALIRGLDKSIFSYYASYVFQSGFYYGPTVTTPYPSRAVVVCGQGL